MNQLLGIVFLACLLVGCGGSSSGLDPTAPTQNTAPTILVNGSAAAAAFEVSIAEGTTAVATVTASDAESSASLSLSGVDADLFELSGDQLSFIAAPDFETPLSTGGNVYSVTAVASDGGANTNQHIEVTVTNVVELAGRVTDGPIAGASVFVDLNCNNAADAGEPTGTTDADGYFEISSGIVAQEGCDPKIIATGGTDTATGEDRAGVALVSDLPAGEANSNVSPLTTIVAAADTAEAKQAVLTALGFSEDTTVDDILTIDSWAGAEADDAGSQDIQRVNSMLATIMSTAASVADDGDAATDNSIAIALAVANAVVGQVEAAAATDDTSVDLTASDMVASVLTDTVAEAVPDLVVTEAVINAVASVVATVNTVAADTTVNPTSAQAIAVATVAQTSVQDSVADVVSGETTIAEFETATDAGTILADVPVDPDAPDFDSDGLADSVDPDDDNDGVNDNQDPFPMDGTEWVDTDGDGTGDNADTDDDGDSVADGDDAFPLDSAESVDTDGDGTGNNADTDDDGDSVADADDAFPLDSAETVDTDGDTIGNNADTDDDGDQVPDIADLDPLDPAVGGNGFKVEHVGLHDFVDGILLEGHVVYGLDPTVSGSTITIAPQNSLDITNLQALADNTSAVGASPQLLLLFSAIPSDGESGTMIVTTTVTDGSDATRDSGERRVTTSVNVEWSSTGDAVTATVPAQTATLTYVDGSGVAVDKTYSNVDLDDVVFGDVLDGVWSLDMKIASFLTQVGSDITFGDFLSAGTYFMDVQIDQPSPQLPNLYYRTDMVNRVQGSFTVADVSLEVTNGFSVGFLGINDMAPDDVSPYDGTMGPPPSTVMMLGETLQVLFTDPVDLATLIAVADGDLSAAGAPELTFQIWQVPDAGESGSFTVEIGVTDGIDSTRDTGERQVTGELAVDWSSDGSNVTVTVPVQNAPVSIMTRDGTAVATTFDNVDPDAISVSSASSVLPANLNIRLMSFFSANESYNLTDAFVAGDYFLNITITDVANKLHYDGMPIDSIQAVIPVE